MNEAPQRIELHGWSIKCEEKWRHKDEANYEILLKTPGLKSLEFLLEWIIEEFKQGNRMISLHFWKVISGLETKS